MAGWNDRFLIDLVEVIKVTVAERGERHVLYDEILSLIKNNDVEIDPKSAKGIDSVYDFVYGAINDDLGEDLFDESLDNEDEAWDDQDRDRF
jgi:hypothetical protein